MTTRRRWRAGVAVVGFALAATVPATAGWVGLAGAAAPEDNPLRGFMPYAGAGGAGGFPHSLEYSYLAMSDLMTGPATFDFGPLEALLDDVASRGNQTVFRLYLDYPDCCPDGTYTTGVPGFLLTGPGAVTFMPYPEHGGGMSPDYENARLLTAIEELVAALGDAYESDPRIGFVQVGLVGMWGEWHTYPHDELMPGLAAQRRVLAAFAGAFDATPLLVSQDALDQLDADTACGPASVCAADFPIWGIGFHDDNFCVGTYDADDNLDWYFEPKLVARGLDELWRELPIGGEIQPAIQEDLFALGWSGQSYEDAVDAVHATFLLDQLAFETDADAGRVARTRTAAARLGYRLRVTEASLADVEADGALHVGVRLANDGVAPFYGAWPVEVAARDADGDVVASWTAPWDLRTILPGEPPTELWLDVADAGLPDGAWEIALRVPNPLPGGKALRLANAGRDGAWLPLGTLTVTAALLFADGFETGDTVAWSGTAGTQ